MDVHFAAHRRLLNPFADYGQLHNAKSVHMWCFTKEHPWLYQTYNDDGRHAVLRTDHLINELWTFEQVLVRSLKPVGLPLTQGRGMTVSVRYQWVFIVYKRAAIHDAMTTSTSKCRNTSEQHKDIGTSRSNRTFFQTRRQSILTIHLTMK